MKEDVLCLRPTYLLSLRTDVCKTYSLIYTWIRELLLYYYHCNDIDNRDFNEYEVTEAQYL